MATIHSFGTSAVYVSDVKLTKDKERIREGKFQVILVQTHFIYQLLVGMIVDEAHCVKKW